MNHCPLCAAARWVKPRRDRLYADLLNLAVGRVIWPAVPMPHSVRTDHERTV